MPRKSKTNTETPAEIMVVADTDDTTETSEVVADTETAAETNTETAETVTDTDDSNIVYIELFAGSFPINIDSINWQSLIDNVYSIYADIYNIRGKLNRLLTVGIEEQQPNIIAETRSYLTEFSNNIGIDPVYDESVYSERDLVTIMGFDIISVLEFFIRSCESIKASQTLNSVKEDCIKSLYNTIHKLEGKPVIPDGQKAYYITNTDGISCKEVSDIESYDFDRVFNIENGRAVYVYAENELNAIIKANAMLSAH